MTRNENVIFKLKLSLLNKQQSFFYSFTKIYDWRSEDLNGFERILKENRL